MAIFVSFKLNQTGSFTAEDIYQRPVHLRKHTLLNRDVLTDVYGLRLISEA